MWKSIRKKAGPVGASSVGAGIAIGVALGAAMDNVGAGLAIGIAIGAALDAGRRVRTSGANQPDQDRSDGPTPK